MQVRVTPSTAAIVGVAIAGLAAAALAAAPADAAPPPDSPDNAFTATLDGILADPMLDGATVSMIVREAKTGTVLYRHNAATRLNPASNAKILTSLAAVGTLGPKWRFHTDVLATGKVRKGVLRSNLYLRGGGDPTLLKRDLNGLAQRLADRGIRRVNGNLVADDHYFDHVPFGAGWAWDDTPYYYSAVTSGLTLAPNTDYDSGTVIVKARPGKHVGDRVRMGTHPGTGVFTFINRSTTGARGSADTLFYERDYGANVIRVSGSYPLGSRAQLDWIPVTSPTEYAGDVFARSLRSHGIRLAGTTTTGRTPAKAHRFAKHRSIKLTELLEPFLKLSNNMHAEALTKTMGKVVRGRGSWGPGTSTILAYLRGLGISTSNLRLWDGSGLSRFDLISARALSDVLLAARQQPWFRVWYEALPVACPATSGEGGTLGWRMCDTPAADNMHAKTGSLAAVSALSGYVTNQAGDGLVFSMLTSNFLHGDPETVEDAVGVALASWSPAAGTD